MFNRVKLMMAVALGRMLGSAPLSLHKAAMDHNRTVDVLRDAAAAVRKKVNGYEHVLARRSKEFRLRLRGRSYKPNGAQECARRVRQGRPTLWTDSQGRRWTFNSHGCVVGFGWASGPNNPRGLFL